MALTALSAIRSASAKLSAIPTTPIARDEVM